MGVNRHSQIHLNTTIIYNIMCYGIYVCAGIVYCADRHANLLCQVHGAQHQLLLLMLVRGVCAGRGRRVVQLLERFNHHFGGHVQRVLECQR